MEGGEGNTWDIKRHNEANRMINISIDKVALPHSMGLTGTSRICHITTERTLITRPHSHAISEPSPLCPLPFSPSLSSSWCTTKTALCVSDAIRSQCKRIRPHFTHSAAPLYTNPVTAGPGTGHNTSYRHTCIQTCNHVYNIHTNTRSHVSTCTCVHVCMYT